MNKPYCIHFFPHKRYACYFDRGYNYLGDDPNVWMKIKIGDIIETDITAFYPQASKKAHRLVKENHCHVTLWTNYYE